MIAETLLIWEGHQIIHVWRVQYGDGVDRAVKLTEINDLLARSGRHATSMADKVMEGDINVILDDMRKRAANEGQ